MNFFLITTLSIVLTEFLPFFGALSTSIKVLLGAIGAFLTLVVGLYFKAKKEGRDSDNHQILIEKNKSEVEEKLRQSIADLTQNVQELNALWLEENKNKTIAESNAVRREVAMKLLEEICPDCYAQLPSHFKN